jgi:hypothetical protein
MIEDNLRPGFCTFNKKNFKLPENPVFSENDLIALEKNFSVICSRIAENKGYNVIVGFRPDIKMHLGYRFLSDMINYFSSYGGQVYLISPELEKKLLGNPIKAGFDIQNTHFYRSLKNKNKIIVATDNLGNGTNQMLNEIGNIYSLDFLDYLSNLV